MSTKKDPLRPSPNYSVDFSLTPENAQEKGYEFLGDVIYDSDAPWIAMKDIIEKIEKENCMLGLSASVLGADTYVGLYKPLPNKP